MPLMLGLALSAALSQAPFGAALSGRVLDSNGAPLPGAEVTIDHLGPGPRSFDDRQPTATTDKNGQYQFVDVTPGRLRLRARKPGFASSNDGYLDVTLTPGERRDGLDLVLSKGAAIAGRVLDEYGQPVIYAQVSALQKRPRPPNAAPDWRSFIRSGDRGETNDLGEFRIFGLSAGEYYVQASVPRFNTARLPPTAFLPTFFPGTADVDTAVPVNLSVGDVASAVDIRLISVAAFAVSGVVINSAGQGVGNAMVTLTLEQTPSGPAVTNLPYRTHTDAAGRFVLTGVTSGNYTLVTVAPVVIAVAPRAVTRGGSNVSESTIHTAIQGTLNGSIITETRNGTTVEYRDALGTRVQIRVDQSDVGGLEVMVTSQH